MNERYRQKVRPAYEVFKEEYTQGMEKVRKEKVKMIDITPLGLISVPLRKKYYSLEEKIK